MSEPFFSVGTGSTFSFTIDGQGSGASVRAGARAGPHPTVARDYLQFLVDDAAGYRYFASLFFEPQYWTVGEHAMRYQEVGGSGYRLDLAHRDNRTNIFFGEGSVVFTEVGTEEGDTVAGTLMVPIYLDAN